MDKDKQEQIRSIQATYASDQARERLQFAINTLQRSMYDMECYLEKLETAENDFERSQILNWAINYLVTGIQPNLRIDLLAHSQAELAKLGA